VKTQFKAAGSVDRVKSAIPLWNPVYKKHEFYLWSTSLYRKRILNQEEA